MIVKIIQLNFRITSFKLSTKKSLHTDNYIITNFNSISKKRFSEITLIYDSN